MSTPEGGMPKMCAFRRFPLYVMITRCLIFKWFLIQPCCKVHVKLNARLIHLYISDDVLCIINILCYNSVNLFLLHHILLVIPLFYDTSHLSGCVVVLSICLSMD